VQLVSLIDLLCAMRADLGRQCDPAEFDRSHHVQPIHDLEEAELADALGFNYHAR
jgi:hypothetical protein